MTDQPQPVWARPPEPVTVPSTVYVAPPDHGEWADQPFLGPQPWDWPPRGR